MFFRGGDIPTADQIKEIAEKFKSFVKSVKRKADIKTVSVCFA